MKDKKYAVAGLVLLIAITTGIILLIINTITLTNIVQASMSNTTLSPEESKAQALPQEQIKQSVELCTTHNTDVLKMIDISQCNLAVGDTVEYWIKLGYKIVGTGDGYVYMTK